MKKISRNVRSTEISDVANGLTEAYSLATDLSVDTALSGMMNEITGMNVELVEAIRRTKVLSTLEDADILRDNKVHELYFFLLANKYVSGTEKQEAAAALNEVFNKYGTAVCKENYIAESALIESLLADFADESLQTYEGLLEGVSTALTELKEAQKAFAQAKYAFENAQIVHDNKAIASDLKKRMIEMINGRLIQYLEVMKKNKNEAYLSFADAVDKVVTDANATIHRRSSKTREGDETEEVQK